MISDREWLFSLIETDADVLHDFIERVGIKLDSIENPTEEQVTKARTESYTGMFLEQLSIYF